ncbi:MAG: ABC transporter ATP-binding protein [Gemmatimonadales bacterium]|nr:ABC transporter ATP-binding protein [Gemmatimonadales bacterium]
MTGAERGASEAGLVVRGLRAPFGTGPGLEEISLDVAPDERLALVGASGAGKTTLLRAIAGLGPGRAERLLVGGREIGSLPPERRGIVYLHQTPLLFPHLSVAENIAFPLTVRGRRGAEAAVAVREVMQALRIDGLEHRRVQTLSGGQRHRAALARAIVARPAVLLLDEPFASLDPALREEVREAVRAAQAAYRPALVIVTHDLDEAGTLADRIGVLLGGRLAQAGTPAELFTRPGTLAVARFLGLANEVAGVVTSDGSFASPIGVLPVRTDLAPGPGIAVFASGAIRIADDGAIAARVLELRHRVQQTTAVVAIGETRMEVALDAGRSVAVGQEVRLALSREGVSVYPREQHPVQSSRFTG